MAPVLTGYNKRRASFLLLPINGTGQGPDGPRTPSSPGDAVHDPRSPHRARTVIDSKQDSPPFAGVLPIAFSALLTPMALATPQDPPVPEASVAVEEATVAAAPLPQETGGSPWLVTPTFSVDPKLGSTLGAVVGYIHRFDPESNPSLLTLVGGYSNTDSHYTGFIADTYFSANQHKLIFGAVSGRVRNEYDDFLGSGLPAETEDNMSALFARYMYRIQSGWYVGVQGISADYVIGAEGFAGMFLNQIGLTGLRSTGLGLVGEYDSRDIVWNPTSGRHVALHNVAYRESLGGEESFDALQLKYTEYIAFGDGHVLAADLRGRWTKDAPQSGFSSLDMRGYTRGNYLARHSTHLQLDARFHLRERWGAALFGGVGALYSSLSDLDSSDALFPVGGAGLIYDLKPDDGIVLRLDYALGEDDNSAFYLTLGQPF